MDENRGPTMYNGRLNRAAKALSVAIELSAGILRKFIGEEMALLLMKVNCAYDIPCMLGTSGCKYPHIDNNCSICFKEWLESEVDKE